MDDHSNVCEEEETFALYILEHYVVLETHGLGPRTGCSELWRDTPCIGLQTPLRYQVVYPERPRITKHALIFNFTLT